MQRIYVARLAIILEASMFLTVELQQAEGNWPQWRGPNLDGTTTGNPPLVWDSRTNVKWKTPIPGQGSATPIVWGNRIFVLTAIETDRRAESAGQSDEQSPEQQNDRRRSGRRQASPNNHYQFAVICVDRNSGNILWQQVANEAVPHESKHGDNTYASGSPVTDGEYVYAYFNSFGIYCYDMEGNLQWSKDLGDMETRRGFGEGASPALADGTLVINWDHEGQSFIVALDAVSGDEKWRQDRDETSNWTTPLVVEENGSSQVVVNGTNRVRSYDFDSGELIWECGGQVQLPIPCPVVLDGVVYVMSGHRGSAAYAIPLSSRGDITGTEDIVWQRNQDTPYVPSPLLYDETLYFTKGNNAVLTSVDARTGEEIISPVRIPGISSIYASPVGVADYVYITGRDGTTVVVRHRDQFEVVATNRLGEPVDASPAVVGDEIFLRSDKHLYCIAE